MSPKGRANAPPALLVSLCCCSSPSPVRRRGRLRAAGERRPRNPADRQLGNARNRRHPRRCRGQGCDERALRRLAHRPAPGFQALVGENPQCARRARRRTCPTRRSTRSSARSTSSASRSAPTAISPTSASCSIAREPRPSSGVEGGEIRRSIPMLLIPITVSGGTATSVELKNAVAAGLGAITAPRKARSTMSGSAAWASIPMLVNAAQIDAPRARLVAQYPRSLRRGRHPGRRSPAAAALSRRAGAGALHRPPRPRS